MHACHKTVKPTIAWSGKRKRKRKHRQRHVHWLFSLYPFFDNLGGSDPFAKATADLPISPTVHYHTIVGVYKPIESLVDSSDGVVPYRSAHLEGADSELAVPSRHGVQETSGAILGLRRILVACEGSGGQTVIAVATAVASRLIATEVAPTS